MYGIIRRTLDDDGYAEDVLQQTFLRIWHAIDQYDESRGALFTWMSTIARNLALDLRRLKSYDARSKTDDLGNIVYTSKSATEDNPGAALDVSRLLGAMEEKYRIVLEMMYLQGFTQAEIAEKLEIPLGTVKTRTKKAIDILRDALQDERPLFAGDIRILLALVSYSGIIETFGQ